MSSKDLTDAFTKRFGREPVYSVSAPGRTELGGNHTDHQHGLVLAAAVTLETRAAAAPNGLSCIRIHSEGFDDFTVDLNDLSARKEEQGTSAALVRGIAAGFAEKGHPFCGFDAAITSSVLPGSGLSSSASFEVLIGRIGNELTGARLTPVEIAKIGQFAENRYYGKPSGLMDQMVCSVGGVLAIDFENTQDPVITPVDHDFSASGYQLMIIDSGADHQDLTSEYAAITEELSLICSYFEKKVLREIPEANFYENLDNLRQLAGDRAVLRAIHVYEENRRVLRQVSALQCGNFEEYLSLVNASGASSWQYLQNVIPAGNTAHQEMAVTLALVSKELHGAGACRLQGGGFGGTVQAYVPKADVVTFTKNLEALIGKEKIRPVFLQKSGSGPV